MTSIFKRRYLLIQILLTILILSINVVAADPVLEFIDPTPDDDVSQTSGIVEINISIEEENLNQLDYNWDETNYTIYDDSLVLMYNFDNVASLGEDSSTVVDMSRYGNNGTVTSTSSPGSSKIDTSSAEFSASTTYISYSADNAFDGDTLTYWWSTNAANEDWLKIEFDTAKTVTGSRVMHDDVVILNGRLEGSNNDADWTEIDTFSQDGIDTWFNETFENSNSYKYYRLYFTTGSPSANWVKIKEWELYEGGTSSLYTSDGKYNGAFEFDGENDYINLGTISSGDSLMLANQEFTISAWIYPKTGDNYQRLVDKSTGNGGDDGYAIYIYNDGDIKLAVDNVAELKVQPEYQGIDIHDGWHYLTAIATDSYFTIYVDCINITTRSMQGTPTLPPDYETTFLIGNWNLDNRYWNGSIDEMRIWNRELSEEEIYQQYASNLNKYDTTQWYLHINQSKNAIEELDIGTYTYQAFATDTGSNQAGTEERTINIIGVSPPVPESSTIMLCGLGSLIILGFIFYKRRYDI